MKINSSIFGTTTYTGTAAEFVASGVKINGEALDAVGLSILKKYGVVHSAGVATKGASTRGRAAVIFTMASKHGFEIGM